VTAFIEERREAFGVEQVCRVLEVPVSTYYARRSRVPSERELSDLVLLERIGEARSGYRRVYGARKTWKELRRREVEVGRDQVARVMRQNGLEGKRKGGKKRTTIPDETAAERARDLLQRDFSTTGPNQKWVCDLTYVRTWNGFCYLAFVLDCYSRVIVGWQLARHMRAELVVDALEMANGLRQPDEGLIAHSDRGSQYCSVSYTERLDEFGIAPSVGSKGDAYDNANGRVVGRDLQERTGRRPHLPQLRARRARDTQLDRLLQQREAPREPRRHPTRRVRTDGQPIN